MSNLFTELQAEQEKQREVVTQKDTPPSPIEQPEQMKPRTSRHPSKRVQTSAPTDARTRASVYTSVKKKVSNRRRLVGSTFRYQHEELERLDAISKKVNQDQEITVSKNDVVRIALNWLLEDHDANKRASVLAKVLARLRR